MKWVEDVGYWCCVVAVAMIVIALIYNVTATVVALTGGRF